MKGKRKIGTMQRVSESRAITEGIGNGTWEGEDKHEIHRKQEWHGSERQGHAEGK